MFKGIIKVYRSFFKVDNKVKDKIVVFHIFIFLFLCLSIGILSYILYNHLQLSNTSDYNNLRLKLNHMFLLESTQTADQIIALYKTLLEQETTNHSIIVTVLLGITVFLVGFQWWWNKEGANKFIEKKIKEELENKEPELQSIIDKKINTIVEMKLKEFKSRFMESEALLWASIANDTRSTDPGLSVFYLAHALNNAIEINVPKSIRATVDLIIVTLGQIKDNKITSLDQVKMIASKIPEILVSEREKILIFLEGCTNRKIK